MLAWIEKEELGEDEINRAIMEERNKEIQRITEDVAIINELMNDLAIMVNEQGEKIENIEQVVENATINVNEATKDLESAETYMEKSRRMLRDIIIVISGTGLGAVGFIAGPIIGAVTLSSGLVLGAGTVATIHKIQS